MKPFERLLNERGLAEVLAPIARKHGCTLVELGEGTMRPHVVEARVDAARLLATRYRYSQMEIARLLSLDPRTLRKCPVNRVMAADFVLEQFERARSVVRCT